MKEPTLSHWVLVLEALGFLLVLVVIAADEFLDVPNLLLGAPATPLRMAEFWFESATVVLLGTAIMLTTLWLFRRIRQLESYVVICAWCNKVRVDNAWVPIAEYLAQRHNETTSHGICESCHAREIAAAAATRGQKLS
jgi:hypothetical protein